MALSSFDIDNSTDTAVIMFKCRIIQTLCALSALIYHMFSHTRVLSLLGFVFIQLRFYMEVLY